MLFVFLCCTETDTSLSSPPPLYLQHWLCPTSWLLFFIYLHPPLSSVRLPLFVTFHPRSKSVIFTSTCTCAVRTAHNIAVHCRRPMRPCEHTMPMCAAHPWSALPAGHLCVSVIWRQAASTVHPPSVFASDTFFVRELTHLHPQSKSYTIQYVSLLAVSRIIKSQCALRITRDPLR